MGVMVVLNRLMESIRKKIMGKDQQMLSEAYDQVQEGIWNRAAGRVSQAASAVQGASAAAGGLAQAAKGAIQQGAGAIGNKLAGQGAGTGQTATAGAQNVKQGLAATQGVGDAAQAGKYSGYISSITKTIVKDLTAMKMPVRDEAKFALEFQQLLTRHLADVDTNKGALNTPTGQRSVAAGSRQKSAQGV